MQEGCAIWVNYFAFPANHLSALLYAQTSLVHGLSHQRQID